MPWSFYSRVQNILTLAKLDFGPIEGLGILALSYLHLLCCIVSCDNSSLYPSPSRNCVLKMDGLYQKLFCRKIPETISRAIFKLYVLVTIYFHENISPNFHEFLNPLSCFDKKTKTNNQKRLVLIS